MNHNRYSEITLFTVGSLQQVFKMGVRGPSLATLYVQSVSSGDTQVVCDCPLIVCLACCSPVGRIVRYCSPDLCVKLSCP